MLKSGSDPSWIWVKLKELQGTGYYTPISRLACGISHMRKYIIAPTGIQNYPNQYVPTLRDGDYEEKLKKLN